jgi:hypothetical protein
MRYNSPFVYLMIMQTHLVNSVLENVRDAEIRQLTYLNGNSINKGINIALCLYF